MKTDSENWGMGFLECTDSILKKKKNDFIFVTLFRNCKKLFILRRRTFVSQVIISYYLLKGACYEVVVKDIAILAKF